MKFSDDSRSRGAGLLRTLSITLAVALACTPEATPKGGPAGSKSDDADVTAPQASPLAGESNGRWEGIVVDTRDEPAGDNCPHGGVALIKGKDENRNNVLDPAEVTAIDYVCNGSDGSEGEDGDDGQTSLIRSQPEAPGDICLAGGVALSWGTDADADGTLDAGEVQGTEYLCNGQNGQDGQNGQNALVEFDDESPGEHCTEGGILVRAGLDLDGDGALDAGEVTQATFVCHGSNGLSALVTQTLEEAGEHCEFGGTRIDSGVDEDEDGILDPEEIDHTSYVCNCAPCCDGAGGAGGTGGSGGGGSGGEGGDLVLEGEVVIQPAVITLEVIDGVIPAQALVVLVDGEDVTDQVSWSFEKPSLGSVQNDAFVPGGTLGGAGVLRADVGGLSGQANVSVYIRVTDASNVTPANKALLDNPTMSSDPALSLVYPSSGTVFPLGILAPEMMWNGTNTSDVYKLVLEETYYRHTVYFSAPAPSRYTLPAAAWNAVTRSGAGAQSDPLSVRLGRLTGGTAYLPVSQTWHVAQQELPGSIHYTATPDTCGTQQNVRISLDETTPEVPLNITTCVGCHTVSRNGRSMMTAIETGAPFGQVTFDLSQSPAVPGAISTSSGFSGSFGAFDATGARLLLSKDDFSGRRQLRVVDTGSAAILNADVLSGDCGEPAWSPDGRKISAICGLANGAAGWAFDSNEGELVTADIAADSSVSGFEVRAVQSGFPGRPAYPSFSSDSQWIAYGRPTVGSRSNADGTLWMVSAEGTQTFKQLLTAGSDNKSFYPNFAPVRAGGYYWIVFASRRDYGNRLVATNRQQLWVAAISDPPVDSDPSHPAFYVQGQSSCMKSLHPTFTRDACLDLGASCDKGIDCCSNTCSGGVCSNAEACSADLNGCEESADCCNASATCRDGFCQPAFAP